MELNISRVLALPGTLVANTIYLVAHSATELKVVAVGNTPADVRTSIVSNDVDAKISAAIGALDLSNSALYVGDIAARDALVLTKSSFVLVADASADATVDVGAALYFYNSVTAAWTKVAEYESMDVIIPNKGILEDLGDMTGELSYKGKPVTPNRAVVADLGDKDGNLTYKGKAVGTVQAGVQEW